MTMNYADLEARLVADCTALRERIADWATGFGLDEPSWGPARSFVWAQGPMKEAADLKVAGHVLKSLRTARDELEQSYEEWEAATKEHILGVVVNSANWPPHSTNPIRNEMALLELSAWAEMYKRFVGWL